jgi:hypothetical protein
MSPVRRITLFKIPSESDITEVLAAYDVLMATNLKVSYLPLFRPVPSFPFPLPSPHPTHILLQDSKPYIMTCVASRVYNTSESRSEGYTVAVQSTFANKEDVEFYDKECPAHKELKKITTRVHRGLCTLLME